MSRPKVYLSPALHQHDNPCSYDKKCGENIHCAAYMDALIPYLDACGIEWKRSDPANKGARYARTIAESNAWGADVHFVKHTNAVASHNAKGSRIFVWPTGDGKKIAEQMLEERRKFYPAGGKVIENTDLTEIKNTAAVCVYDELVFHDNPEDAAFLHEHLREFAEADAKALCEYFQIPFVDPYAKKPEPEKAPAATNKAPSTLTKINPRVKEFQLAAIADGFKFPKYGADGVWGAECESVAEKAIVKQRDGKYLYPNLTKFVQRVLGFEGKAVDGLCGPKTGDAIEMYQRAHNLVPDRCVGVQTYKVMVNAN